MRKVFIDIGAYNGDSIVAFHKKINDSLDYEIHAFEANPELWHHFDNINVTLHKKAVWIEDGEIDFFIGEDNTGSTLVGTKTTGGIDYKNPIKTQGIDIDKWIRENFQPEDRIILKMDIEGGEFEVIPHMIRGGSVKYLKEMWVEMHSNKVTKYFTHDKENLIQDIKNEGVIFRDWH